MISRLRATARTKKNYCASLKVLRIIHWKIEKLPAALIGGAEITLRDKWIARPPPPYSVFFAVLDLHLQ